MTQGRRHWGVSTSAQCSGPRHARIARTFRKPASPIPQCVDTAAVVAARTDVAGAAVVKPAAGSVAHDGGIMVG